MIYIVYNDIHLEVVRRKNSVYLVYRMSYMVMNTATDDIKSPVNLILCFKQNRASFTKLSVKVTTCFIRILSSHKQIFSLKTITLVKIVGRT